MAILMVDTKVAEPKAHTIITHAFCEHCHDRISRTEATVPNRTWPWFHTATGEERCATD